MVMLLAFLITGSILSKTNLSLGFFFFLKANIFSRRRDINVAFVPAAERALFYIAAGFKLASKLMNVNLSAEGRVERIPIPLVSVQKPTSDSLCHFLISSP